MNIKIREFEKEDIHKINTICNEVAIEENGLLMKNGKYEDIIPNYINL